MKMGRLKTIWMSAYLSAMLASSTAPVRGVATLAGTIDLAAAQKGFQSVAGSLGNGAWRSDSATIVSPAPQLMENDPVLSEDSMTRLIRHAQSAPKIGSIAAGFCAALGLCDGTKPLPLKMIKSSLPDVSYFFGIPPADDSKDIFVMVARPQASYVYLTDRTKKLRAAIVSDQTGVHMILNENAEKGFNAALEIFAKVAAKLPPAGTSIASAN